LSQIHSVKKIESNSEAWKPREAVTKFIVFKMVAKKDARVMPFFEENSLPVTLSREVGT